MTSLEDIRNERLKKRAILEERGLYPYPVRSERSVTVRELADSFERYETGGEAVTVAGRLTSVRDQGKLSFLTVADSTGEFQVVVQVDGLGEEQYALFVDTVDEGDLVEFSGVAFKTKRGTPSVQAKSWQMLAKTLRPLPSSWYGLHDTEERYRRRYVDLLMNPELKDLFKKKAMFWSAARSYIESKGFLEVHTPSLEMTTGGAEARPFKTHHNDFDMDVFLRISVGELWQKRLMVAGFERVYEIGRAYRNEGSSPEHLQEFTNLEFYASYLDFDAGLDLTTEFYRTVAGEVFGTTAFTTRGHSFDLAADWEELDYVSTVERMTDLNVLAASQIDLKRKLKELGVTYEGETRERLIDSLWKWCRKQISGPAILLNHPKSVAPLSRVHDDDERLTKTAQIIIAGSELGRAHAELNDPLDQAERFKEQQKLLEQGDDEAMMPDWEYVEALEYGMPPTFGFGVGERLFAFLADVSLREATLFPLLRPKDGGREEG